MIIFGAIILGVVVFLYVSVFSDNKKDARELQKKAMLIMSETFVKIVRCYE